MNEYYLTEFCLLYKRLAIIETSLKELIILKYTDMYKEKAYIILYRYFKNLDMQRNDRNKPFEAIFNSSKTNFEKLTISINKMYLRETLLIFSNYVFIKNKIRKTFWNKPVDVKSSEFQKNQKYLKELRNCIAHFNTKKYSLERTKLIPSLLYFEELLNCKETIIGENIISFIKTSKKLSITNILKIIYSINKNYFNDDKLLINIFDDIAILNGYSYQNLPQRWSIIRQKYDLFGNLKKNENEELIIFEDKQLRLPLYDENEKKP